MYDTEGNSAEIQRNQLNMKIFLIELYEKTIIVCNI